MATFPFTIVLAAGSVNTGQAASLRYAVTDSASTVRIAATGTGIAESVAGSGTYSVIATLNTAWTLPLKVTWTHATNASFGAEESILGEMAALQALGYSAQTGDSFARLGAPAGASLAADVATRLSASAYTAPDNASAAAAAASAATVAARLTAQRATNLDNLDAAVTTRLASAGYTAPNNSGIASLLASTARFAALPTAGTVDDPAPSAVAFIGDVGLSTEDDTYVLRSLQFTDGTLAGCVRTIASYAGSTRRLTFSLAFPGIPADGDAFEIV